MIATLPTQEQVDQIARDLAPEVVRIRWQAGQDWSEHPAIYFRIVLSDEASRPERLADVTGTVSTRLFDSLGLSESDRIPYFRFRSQGEQAKIGEAAWA
jgi:hypothetical protein